MGRLSRAWNRYWHGPVDPVRPFLLGSIFLIALAFDLWMLRLGKAARYGIDGFNVAHFAWLDAVAPMPVARTYVAVVMVTGFLALWVALGGVGRLALVAVLVLYTYSWSISRLDSYQHHYLFSLLIAARLFFPQTRDCGLGFPDGHSSASAGKGVHASIGNSAWGYRLFGVSVAIVYFYAAVAKWDQQWLSGHTLRRILEPESPAPLWTIVRNAGISPDATLVPMAMGAIVLELALAAAYLGSPFLDRGPPRRPARWINLLAWFFALALHLGIEAANFSIGWFSIYMLLTASIFFLPATLLRLPCRMLFAVWKRFGTSFAVDDRAPGNRPTHDWRVRGAGVFFVVLSGVLAVALGRRTDLPGATLAGSVVAVLIAVSVAAPLAQGAVAVVIRRVVSGTVCCVLMWLAVVSTSARFNFYWDLGRNEWAFGRPEQARRALLKADQYLPSEDAKACIDLGAVLLSAGDVDRAIELFRRAKQLRPQDGAVHVHLGLAHGHQQELDKAVAHFRTALKFDPEDVAARTNLGAALFRMGRRQEAVVHYRKALEATPTRTEVRAALARALAASGQWPEAIVQYRQVLDVRPGDSTLHFELGHALEVQGQIDDALRHYRRASRIADATGQQVLASRIRPRIEALQKRQEGNHPQ